MELALVNHTEDAIQSLAFVLAGLGLLVSLAFLGRRGRTTLFLLRACMLLVIVGSGFGIFEHVYNNIAFEREIQPKRDIQPFGLERIGRREPTTRAGAHSRSPGYCLWLGLISTRSLLIPRRFNQAVQVPFEKFFSATAFLFIRLIFDFLCKAILLCEKHHVLAF